MFVTVVQNHNIQIIIQGLHLFCFIGDQMIYEYFSNFRSIIVVLSKLEGFMYAFYHLEIYFFVLIIVELGVDIIKIYVEFLLMLLEEQVHAG